MKPLARAKKPLFTFIFTLLETKTAFVSLLELQFQTLHEEVQTLLRVHSHLQNMAMTPLLKSHYRIENQGSSSASANSNQGSFARALSSLSTSKMPYINPMLPRTPDGTPYSTINGFTHKLSNFSPPDALSFAIQSFAGFRLFNVSHSSPV